MSETNVPNTKSKSRPVTAVVMLLALVVLFGGGYGLYSHYATPPLDRYAQVLAAFKDHKITYDENGRADLTRQFPGITGHNDAYVTYRDDGTFIVMFPTYYGIGQEVAGLVYTSRPLTGDDTHGRISATHFDQKLIEAGSYGHLLLEKKINDNWYQVSYKIH